jgi:speckle-type POZ protein
LIIILVNLHLQMHYEMMDNSWMDQFWTAATEQKLTDVDINVGTDKLMEAHRVILAARSPVLKEAFNKTNDTGKSVLTFDGEFDVVVVENFLNFLYTGSLETFSSKSINYKQLFKLATLYEVETLTNICQVANNVPEVEDFPNSLMIGLSN